MSDTLLHIEGLYKKFARSLKRSMIYGTADTFRSMAGMRYNTSQLRKSEFWALEDINLELKRGETLGLIGANGSGKSTLLRLINGIFPPDLGKISINGRMGALIAVGAGFHPHMTGRENIFLNATILGMKKDEIRQKFDAIVDFAEIGEFIDAPVATYSSGMTVRLGFSIAIHGEPDILLVDEILAVGDLAFQNKCYNLIAELKKSASIILVSHNMTIISNFCDHVSLIHKGKMLFNGQTDRAIFQYNQLNLESSGIFRSYIVPQNGNDIFKINEIEISPWSAENKCISDGNLNLKISFESLRDINDIMINSIIYIPYPMPIPYFQATNKSYNKKLEIKKGVGEIVVSFEDISLNNQSAKLNFSIWAESYTQHLLYITDIPIYFNQKNELSNGIDFFNIKYLIK